MSAITREVEGYTNRELIQKLTGQIYVIETLEKRESKILPGNKEDFHAMIEDRKEFRRAIENEMLKRMERL